jgi:hypothetical protein
MAIARAHPAKIAVTRRYHHITCCIRRAFSLGEAEHNVNRKDRSDRTATQRTFPIFPVSLGNFSIMDNHPHILLCLDPGHWLATSHLSTLEGSW